MEQPKTTQYYVDYWKDKLPKLSEAIKFLDEQKELSTCKLCIFWDNESTKWEGQIGIKSEGFCKNKTINAQVSFGYGDGKCFNENFGCIHHELIEEISDLLDKYIPNDNEK